MRNECGCYIEMLTEPMVIVYCPLHKAAPDMFNNLHSIRRWFQACEGQSARHECEMIESVLKKAGAR